MKIVKNDSKPFKGFKKEGYKSTDIKLSKDGQCVVTVFEKNSKISDNLPDKIACKNIPVTRLDGSNIRECHILKKCKHNNILQLYFWEIIEIKYIGSQFIVLYTELCDQNLKTFLKENNSLSQSDILTLIMQLVSGCQYLHHTEHVVHRDIKPENILVCKSNTPGDAVLKFGDFGLSRFMPQSSSTSTLQFTACGTRDYCSPEMMHAIIKSSYLAGDPFSTDIFSLGVVFHEMFTGERPFNQVDLHKPTTEIDVEHVVGTWFSKKAIDLKSSKLCLGVIRMLQWNPENRPTANELTSFFQHSEIMVARKVKPTSLTTLGFNGRTKSIDKKTSLKKQFEAFSKFGDKTTNGRTIKLSQSDKWFKQANVIDGKRLTTTDTAIAFMKISKNRPKLSFSDWNKFLDEITRSKRMGIDDIKERLTKCGNPDITGTTTVTKSPVTDRLTDFSKYGGTHKQRFDSMGKGRGKEGRVDPESEGYVLGYKEKGTYDKRNSFVRASVIGYW